MCSLSLEVAYYNENLAVWEPLIEPVIQNNKKRRWELTAEVSNFIFYNDTKNHYFQYKKFLFPNMNTNI